jgi:hypothetical protein
MYLMVYKSELPYAVLWSQRLKYCITPILPPDYLQYYIGRHLKTMAARVSVEELLTRNKYVNSPALRDSGLTLAGRLP